MSSEIEFWDKGVSANNPRICYSFDLCGDMSVTVKINTSQQSTMYIFNRYKWNLNH